MHQTFKSLLHRYHSPSNFCTPLTNLFIPCFKSSKLMLFTFPFPSYNPHCHIHTCHVPYVLFSPNLNCIYPHSSTKDIPDCIFNSLAYPLHNKNHLNSHRVPYPLVRSSFTYRCIFHNFCSSLLEF